MKKKISLLLATVLAFSALAACSSSTTTEATTTATTETAAATTETATEEAVAEEAAPTAEASSDSKGVIYGIYKSGDQTWFLDEGAAAQATAEAAGYEFIYVDVQLDPNKYTAAIDNAIANNAAGVVTCTPDQTMSQVVVDALAEAGIPVVAADDALEVNGEKLVPWVGINGYVIGEACGAWMAEQAIANDLVGREDVGLLIMTMDTVSSCVPRTEGEYDIFTSMCPEFPESNIFRADGDGTTEKGNTGASAVITGNPQITTWLVVGGNEESCHGAARALESAGLDGDAIVCGLGGYMAKDEFKVEGGTCVKASAYFSADGVGGGSVSVLLDLINGEEVPMETAVDATIVTVDNYVEVMGAAAE
ncbi:MAG: substrate-binding domain-containing protein [Eubacteriales bacterium]